MKRINVSSGSPLEPRIGFSRAVRKGSWVCIAGTAPIAPDGGTAGEGDVYRQTRRCIEIMADALHDAGAAIEDVVRTRILLTDISRWQEAARAHGECFGEIRPVTTFMQVSAFIEPDWLVELEADALVEEPSA